MMEWECPRCRSTLIPCYCEDLPEEPPFPQVRWPCFTCGKTLCMCPITTAHPKIELLQKLEDLRTGTGNGPPTVEDLLDALIDYLRKNPT